MCEEEKPAPCKQCELARKALKQKTQIIADLERRLLIAEQGLAHPTKVRLQR